MLLTLTSCVTSGSVERASLPDVPQDIVACFETTVGPPPAGQALTKGMVVDLIAQLVESDLNKTLCGRRLIEWYKTLQKEKAP